jgi:hypothetical protein
MLLQIPDFSTTIDCGCKIDTQDFVRQELNKVPGADPKAIEALTLPNFTE